MKLRPRGLARTTEKQMPAARSRFHRCESTNRNYVRGLRDRLLRVCRATAKGGVLIRRQLRTIRSHSAARFCDRAIPAAQQPNPIPPFRNESAAAGDAKTRLVSL